MSNPFGGYYYRHKSTTRHIINPTDDPLMPFFTEEEWKEITGVLGLPPKIKPMDETNKGETTTEHRIIHVD